MTDIHKPTFCSLSGAMTYLDTHLVLLHGINPALIYRMLLGDNPTGVPPQYVPDIIHECVHHWCFKSPVGNALLLLRYEIIERSLEDENARVLRILLARYLLIKELLRPVAEGLACFAEFDAFPGNGNLRAAPLEWIAIAAEPRAVEESRSEEASIDDDTRIARLLRNVRNREDTARRKEALLIRPLDPEQGDGYLLGYMLIKGLQRLHIGYESNLGEDITAAQVAEDSELLLSYYKAFFFDDISLATLLLVPPSTSDILEDLSGIRKHIGKRFDQLSDRASIAARLDMFNSLYLPSSADLSSADAPRQRSFADALAYNFEDTGRLKSLVLAKEKQLNKRSGDTSLQIIRAFLKSLLASNAWLCFGSISGRVVISQGGVVAFYDAKDQIRALVGPQSTPENLRQYMQLEECEEEASMECWISQLGAAMIVVIGSKRGFHYVKLFWQSDPDLVEDFVSSAMTNSRLMDISKGIRDIADRHLAAQPFYEPLRNLIRSVLEEDAADQIDLAIRMFQGTAETKQKLWTNGFADILNLPTLQAFTALGLLQSVGIGPSDGYVPEKDFIRAMDAAADQGIVEGGLFLVDYDVNDRDRILI